MRNYVKAFIAGILASATFLQGAAWWLANQNWGSFVSPANFAPLAEPVGVPVPLIGLECVIGAVAGLIIWRLIRRSEAAGYYVAGILLSALSAVAVVVVLTWAGLGQSVTDWITRCEAAAAAGAAWGLGFTLFMQGLRQLP